MKSRMMLSPELKKLVHEETIKQVQHERSYYTLCAIKLCLYVMYCEFGFGEKRLARLYEHMMQYVDELNARVEKILPGIHLLLPISTHRWVQTVVVGILDGDFRPRHRLHIIPGDFILALVHLSRMIVSLMTTAGWRRSTPN